MKYLAIIYGNKEMWASFPPEVAAKAIGEVDAFNRRHTESGELLGSPPKTLRRVWSRG